MATYPEQVTCAKMEINTDGSQTWTPAKKGFVTIGEGEIKFEPWKIPFSNIKNAILNREKVFFMFSHYSLLIETDFGSFLFSLDKSDVWENLPFPCKKTEGSLINLKELLKPSLIIGLLVILVLLLDFIK